VSPTLSRFDQFYFEQFGSRWEPLKQSLLHPAEKTLRSCFGGHATYRMDQASIIAAQALGVQPGDQVLDMCAAPGGKALILAEFLGDSGSLIANEMSQARRLRLKEVLDSHVPVDVRARVHITSFDGNQFGLKKANSFDRVLLDAPCSSEQHLLDADPTQKEWKDSRTKQLAMRQYSLLCSALLALKPGGTVLYST
jgi:16S rRNA C967 or C1407 C5-methylase (RsmB/RsmF family)